MIARHHSQVHRTAGHCVCAFLELVLNDGSFPFRELALPSRRQRRPLVRQAKLDVSCKVKVLTEQGLTSHSYRVLQ
jgi:hypothetical protein